MSHSFHHLHIYFMVYLMDVPLPVLSTLIDDIGMQLQSNCLKRQERRSVVLFCCRTVVYKNILRFVHKTLDSKVSLSVFQPLFMSYNSLGKNWTVNLLLLVLQVFAIHSYERFVLATTDRTVLDFDKFGEWISPCWCKSTAMNYR